MFEGDELSATILLESGSVCVRRHRWCQQRVGLVQNGRELPAGKAFLISVMSFRRPMFQLVCNLVRMTMLEAATRQSVRADRINFVDALRWLANARPGAVLPKLLVNPSRPGRHEPRARKRRLKEHDPLNKHRAERRETLRQQSFAAYFDDARPRPL